MKIYPKKLRSIEDLERERKRVQKQADRLDKEEFFSFDGLSAKNASKAKSDTGSGAMSDLLPGAGPLVSILVGIIQKRLFSKDEQEPQYTKGPKTQNKGKKILVSLAKEVIGGYLKWKAIELSYKGVKLVIRKTKEKKEREQEQQSSAGKAQ